MEITTLQREQGVSTNQGEERGNMAERIVLAGPSISRRMLCPSHFLIVSLTICWGEEPPGRTTQPPLPLLWKGGRKGGNRRIVEWSSEEITGKGVTA